MKKKCYKNYCVSDKPTGVVGEAGVESTKFLFGLLLADDTKQCSVAGTQTVNILDVQL